MNTETVETLHVFVGMDTIRELHVLPGASVEQTFGEDWTSAPLVQIHPPSLMQQQTGASTAPRKSRPLQVKPGISWSWGIVVAILASLCAWGILLLR
jgi:hypothetical protein